MCFLSRDPQERRALQRSPFQIPACIFSPRKEKQYASSPATLEVAHPALVDRTEQRPFKKPVSKGKVTNCRRLTFQPQTDNEREGKGRFLVSCSGSFRTKHGAGVQQRQNNVGVVYGGKLSGYDYQSWICE